MQRPIIFFTLVACCCGLAMARCMPKEEMEAIINDCMEKAAPGISNNLEKKNRLLNVMTNYDNDETTDYSDPTNQIARQALLCIGNKMDQVYPEFGETFKACDTKTNSQREKRLECIIETEHKRCPNTQEARSKRSTFSLTGLFISSVELQKQKSQFQSSNSEQLIA